MPRLVMKFGGTSVANVERIRNVAAHVAREVAAGYEVAVVVSAMSGKTNELVGWVKDADPRLRCCRVRCRRGLRRAGDLRAAGDRSAEGRHRGPLLAGLAGSDPDLGRPRLGADRGDRRRAPRCRLQARRGRGHRGLPGHSRRDRADHDAWAAAARTPAPWPSPPPSAPSAATSIPTWTGSTPPTRAWCRRRGGMERVTFEEMLEMASLGAKVLQVRSVELAMVHRVPTTVRSSFDPPDAARPGTLICDEDTDVEQQIITGIAFARDEAQITLRRVKDSPGVAAAIFGPLGRRQHQRRHDHPDGLGRPVDHRHDLHRAGRRLRPGPHGPRPGARDRSATRRSRARPTW